MPSVVIAIPISELRNIQQTFGFVEFLNELNEASLDIKFLVRPILGKRT